MIYDTWFASAAGPDWVRVATLSVIRPKGAIAAWNVAIYATDPAYAAELRTQLAAFAPTLPEGAVLGPEVGAAALEDKARPRTTVNASLPADVLAALRAMPRGAERTRAAESARRRGRAPLDPFSAAQTALLTARFEAEWAAIRAGAVPGADVLGPGGAEVGR
ncbi:MAG: hypothetical protein V9G18_05585 [Albidovulum sp.]|jgi:hypothetical protein|uniref:hypothetical protein n=1 Tax=Albidovulum sp. TaxID=1872424 RepID=UPI0030574672